MALGCVSRHIYTTFSFGQTLILFDSRCNNAQFSRSKALKDVSCIRNSLIFILNHSFVMGNVKQFKN